MEKKYTINEIFEFKDGTKFVSKRTPSSQGLLIWISNNTVMVPNGKENTLKTSLKANLTKSWVNSIYTLYEEEGK